MIEYLFGGINERPNGTFSITPHLPLGMIDANLLEAIATVVREFKLPGLQANCRVSRFLRLSRHVS